MPTNDPTLFVVDDDEAVLDALSTMAETADLNVETFLSAEKFLEHYDPQKPGCLVVDVRMPGMSGLDLQEELKNRGVEIPLIVISGHADVPIAVRAVKSGAFDFLEKPFKKQDLLSRVRIAIDEDRQRRSQQGLINEYTRRYESLTPREREVLERLVQGKLGKVIAGELGISYKTMEKFRGNVMRKMQVSSVAELVLIAVTLGIAPLEGEFLEHQRS